MSVCTYCWRKIVLHYTPGSEVSGIMGSLEELLNKSEGMELFRQGGVGTTWH